MSARRRLVRRAIRRPWVSANSRAAEIAGVSRADFIEALGRYGVTPFQYDAGEIASDAERS